MHKFMDKHLKRIILFTVGILVFFVVFLAVAYRVGWTNKWAYSLQETFPDTDFSWMINPDIDEDEEPVGGTILVPVRPTAKPTKAPAVAKPTKAPATAKPTKTPANAKPTKAPTTAPDAGDYKVTGEITVTADDKKTKMETFEFSGIYDKDLDPWYATNGSENYGPAITGKTLVEKTENWLKAVCRSAHQIVRLRVQMGLETIKTLKKENERATALQKMSKKQYSKIVNETLSAFFKHLDGGSIETSSGWALENYMSSTKKGTPELRGRVADGDDEIATFFDKKGNNFVSSERGWYNTLADAGVKSKGYKQDAFVNFYEGGTWKWKPKAKGGGGDKPKVTTPPPKPTSTLKPTTTPPPTSTPKPTSRPTKDPSQQPTGKPGTGKTNPENSEDPKSTKPPTSTPKPKTTPTPKPTVAPTAVPTAVVRPTEDCGDGNPTPIREDLNPTPPPKEHNVPTPEPGIGGDPAGGTDFDPGSV